MTVAESFHGAFRARWGTKQIEHLESWINSYVVIPSSTAMSKKWGEVRFIRRAQPISPADAWIAAADLHLDWPLVTHNARVAHTWRLETVKESTASRKGAKAQRKASSNSFNFFAGLCGFALRLRSGP